MNIVLPSEPLTAGQRPTDAASPPQLPKKLNLLFTSVSYEEAAADEDNVLLESTYPRRKSEYFSYLWDHKRDIEKTVARHLGLGEGEKCRVAPPETWLHGSFNVCFEILVYNWAQHPGRRILIRFPLPYKVGETTCPGNADEKLRCEAATFIWLQQNCADVPIPYLWGFGFSDGSSFTTLANSPLPVRWIEYLRRRFLQMLGYPVPCQYVPHRNPGALNTGYLLMDYIKDSGTRMLLESWDDHKLDKTRRYNLYKDLSRIMLSMARVPVARIGSFTIDRQGVLSLTNRPLTLQLQSLENKGISTGIKRNLTYESADSYYLDLLSYHDNRLRQQPNSINDESDARQQMAALSAMRSVLPHLTERGLRHGPFFVTLTDSCQSNIFVDENWHIKYIVDLEWTCVQPAEMLQPPWWLTGAAVDQLCAEEDFEAFSKLREEFMAAFEEQEALTVLDQKPISRIMKSSWEKGTFWLYHALDDPKALYNIFCLRIARIFTNEYGMNPGVMQIFSPYWTPNADNFIATKLRDREGYLHQLQEAFDQLSSKEEKVIAAHPESLSLLPLTEH